MSKYKNILVMIVFGAVLAMPLLALALDVPGQPVPGQAITLNEVERLINGVARFLIVVSVIVAVIFIVYGGIRWIASPGRWRAARATSSREPRRQRPYTGTR